MADEVLKILREEGIDVLVGSVAKRVRNRGTEIEVEFENSKISGTHLLLGAGQTPNTERLNLQAAGVDVDERGYVKVNDKLETTAKGVYAIGDVKGGPAFTHISYDDYRILKANLLEGQDKSITGRMVPYCMFIDPQLARIGMNEMEAQAKGIPHRVAKMLMTHVARAWETNEKQGFVKAIIDTKSGQILGATVLGPEGGETMSQIQLAMMGGLTASTLADAIFAHPTMAELWNNLFSQT